MSHYDSFFPSVDEVLEAAKKRVEERQKQCKHQWLMHEVTIDGKPLSVSCTHCNKIHRIEKEPEVTFEPKVEDVSCQHSYKFMYRNHVLKTITVKCKHCGDVKESPEEVQVVMDNYLKLLRTIKSCPKSFQSNYARENCALIAEAASRGHLSCLDAQGRNTYVWEVTTAGTVFLSLYGGAV